MKNFTNYVQSKYAFDNIQIYRSSNPDKNDEPGTSKKNSETSRQNEKKNKEWEERNDTETTSTETNSVNENNFSDRDDDCFLDEYPLFYE